MRRAVRSVSRGGEFASFIDELEFLPDNSFVWGRREGSDFDGSPISWGVFRTDFSGETVRLMGQGSNASDGDGAAATAFDIGHDRAGFTRPKFQVLPNEDLYLLRDRPGLPTELYLVHNEVAPVVPSADGSVVYTFDEGGLHQQTLDADTGVVLRSFEYDTAGRLVRSIDREGLTTTIERDASGTPFAVTAPYGQQTSLGTNLDGYLSSVSNTLSESYLLEYDATQPGALSKMTDPLMREHNYTFVDGYLTLDEDPAGGSTALSVTTMGSRQLIEKTTALGRTTLYDLDTLADGASQRNMTDPAGFTTLQQSDQSAGTTVTLPDGTVSSSVSASDPRFGMSAPFAAEAQTTLPSGLTRSVTSTRDVVLSDPADPLSVVSISQTQTVGSDAPSSSVFDAGANSYTSLSPEGRSSITELDSLGRVSRVSVPGIAPVDYTYDADGRIETVTQTSATDGTRTTTYTYDAEGYLQSVTAPSLRQTSYTYDAVGRPLTTTLPDSEQLSTTWDAMDNLQSITPPGRTAHNFTYTLRDQVESYDPPDAGTATGTSGQTYDLDRAPDVSTLMDGRTIEVGYDVHGRVNGVTVGRGIYGYVYSGSDGKLSYTTNPELDRVSFGYDGPLLSSVSWTSFSGTDHPTASVTFGYDDHFRVTSMTVDAESAISYSYDQDGYITAVAPDGSANGMTVTRDPLNGLLTGTSITDSGSGNSVVTSRSHNDFGEAISMNATYQGGDLGYAFSYDADGRIDSRQETSGASSTAQTYEYDLRGRLTDVYVDSVLTYEYDYDENGNRVAFAGPEGTASATYDAQDRLLTYGGTSYTYNDHGQLLTKTDVSGTTSYNYDELGNLLSVTLPDSTLIEYVVDAMGRRVAKKVGGTLVRQWVYQDALNPVAEYDGSGNLIQQFVYATRMNVPDLIIRGGTTYRVIADQVGSVRRVVEVSTGAVAQELTYSPFGKVLSDSSPGWQPFTFAGGLYDNHTKLVRFGARDYDAQVGRWTAKDPIGFASGDPNLYEYGLSSPNNHADPSGTIIPTGGRKVDPLDIMPGGGMATGAGRAGAGIVAKGASWLMKKLFGRGAQEATKQVAKEGAKQAAKTAGQTACKGTAGLAGKLRFTDVTARHMGEAGRHVPVQTLADAIETGARMPDPQAAQGAIKIVQEVVVNGKQKTLEIIYRESDNMILHFLYK